MKFEWTPYRGYKSFSFAPLTGEPGPPGYRELFLRAPYWRTGTPDQRIALVYRGTCNKFVRRVCVPLRPPPPPPPPHKQSDSINQSKVVLTKPHTGREKPHPSTTTEGSKPCVTEVMQARRLDTHLAFTRYCHYQQPINMVWPLQDIVSLRGFIAQ